MEGVVQDGEIIRGGVELTDERMVEDVHHGADFLFL